MSSAHQFDFYTAQQRIAEMEPKAPEKKIPRERIAQIVKSNPRHGWVQCYHQALREAAKTRAAHKVNLDKALTLEKSLLILDAAGAFSV